MNKNKLLLGTIFLLCVLYSFHKIACLDVWLHLKTGEYILRNFKIPHTNTFDYPAANHPWLDIYWLFQIIIFFFYKFTGISGLILFKVAILVLAIWYLYKTANVAGVSPSINAFCILLVILTANERFVVRPEIFSLLFIALYLYILQAYISQRRDILWIIPLLQILWVNTHGLFFLGIVIYGLFLIDRIFMCITKNTNLKETKKLFFIFFLSLLGCFLNPYTYHVFPFLKGMHTALAFKNIPELISPFSPNLRIEQIFFYKLLIGISAISFLLNFRRIRLFHICLYAVFLYISLKAVRNICFFAFVAGTITAINLHQFFEQLKILTIGWEKWTTFLFIPIIFYLTFDVVTNGYYIRNRSNKRFGLGITEATYPIKAVDFVEANKIEGNVLNDSSIGSYFVFRMYPKQRAFIDGRLDWGKPYLASFNQPFHFKKIVKEYNINYILLGHGWSPALGPFIRMLHKSKDWVLVYLDEIAVIFVKNVPRNKDIIERYKIDTPKMAAIKLPFKKFPLSHFHLANIFFTLGKYNLAEKEYKYCIEVYPSYFEAYLNLAYLYNISGNLGMAEEMYLKTISIKPKLLNAYIGLGDIYVKSRDFEKAIWAYETAVKINKDNLLLHQTLALLYLQQKRYKKSLLEVEEMLRINPKNKMAQGLKRMLQAPRFR